MDSLDWNDLRYLVAVARSGSAAAAARLLGVSHATVLRRIQVLEQDVGCPLFHRLSSGYVPTEAGRNLVAVGSSIEVALNDSTRQIEAQVTELAGTIRFTTTDSFGNFVVPPILASFRERYPTIRVDLMVTNTRLDLDKGEADVTLRPSRDPPDSWVGMRLSRFGFGLYASTTYLARRRGVPWQRLDWVMPGGAISGPGEWLRSQVGEAAGVASADTFTGLHSLAVSGFGATLLPRFMGDRDERLRLVQGLPRETSSDVWVLTHPHLRQSGRVHAFMEHLAAGVRALRPTLAPGGFYRSKSSETG